MCYGPVAASALKWFSLFWGAILCVHSTLATSADKQKLRLDSIGRAWFEIGKMDV